MNHIILTAMRALNNPESVSALELDSNWCDASYAHADAVQDIFGDHGSASAAYYVAKAAAEGNLMFFNGWLEEYFKRSGEDKSLYSEAVK